MIRRPPRSTPPDTPFPSTPLFRSHRFVYPRLRDPDSGRADTALYAGQQVYAHVIGTDWRTDPVVFGRAMPSSADIPESDFTEVDIQADAGLAFGRHSAGVAQEFGLYVAPLDSLGRPPVPGRRLFCAPSGHGAHGTPGG